MSNICEWILKKEKAEGERKYGWCGSYMIWQCNEDFICILK